MLEYAPMLHVSYYAQNYAGIIHQGLVCRRWRVAVTALQQLCMGYILCSMDTSKVSLCCCHIILQFCSFH